MIFHQHHGIQIRWTWAQDPQALSEGEGGWESNVSGAPSWRSMLGSTMPDEMITAMLVNVAAFTILYIALLAARIDVARAEEEVAPEDDLAGDAVKAPKLSEVKDV